jgi:hypothetical protein
LDKSNEVLDNVGVPGSFVCRSIFAVHDELNTKLGEDELEELESKSSKSVPVGTHKSFNASLKCGSENFA